MLQILRALDRLVELSPDEVAPRYTILPSLFLPLHGVIRNIVRLVDHPCLHFITQLPLVRPPTSAFPVECPRRSIQSGLASLLAIQEELHKHRKIQEQRTQTPQ